jgi:hypothetical protein
MRNNPLQCHRRLLHINTADVGFLLQRYCPFWFSGSASTQIETAITKLGRRPRETDLGYIDATTQYGVIAELLEPQTAQFLILMHEAGVALQRENWGEFSVRWEYRDDKGKGLGRGRHSVNDMCWKAADSGLLTADLRGNIKLTERGHAFADWLVQSGYKVPHFLV